jgi:ribosomal protein S18 acetylase RimI-like enzyme
MSEFKIRSMQDSEEQQVFEMLQRLDNIERSGYDTSDMPEYASFLSDISEDVLLILKDEDICGFIMYGTTETTCNIMDVFIKEEYRNQGIGSKLFDGLKQKLKEETWIYEIRLGVRANNRAIEFYKNQGFKPYLISMFTTIQR